jgi:hypothetical protein
LFCGASDLDMLNRVILHGKLAFGQLHGRIVPAYALPTVLGLLTM